tara:strand:- start:2534 stop:3004 length:471 start_codon:yes stop_codon:yes gene_type:complete
MSAERLTRNVPYSEIIDLFQQRCDAHLAIASFDSGTLNHLDASAVNRKYPYVYLRPMNSLLLDRTRTLSFELYSLDIPDLNTSSNIQLLTDTEMYIYDLMSYFEFGPTTIQQNYDMAITDCIPVNEAFQDRVFGWMASIDITTPFNLNYCVYPEYP